MVNRPGPQPGLFRACSAGELAGSFPGALPQAVAFRAFGALKPNFGAPNQTLRRDASSILLPKKDQAGSHTDTV